MVYCLLGQIQIWVGSVAFTLRSDHSVLYVHVVVLWWCISVPDDLYLSRFEDLGGIRVTIAERSTYIPSYLRHISNRATGHTLPLFFFFLLASPRPPLSYLKILT